MNFYFNYFASIERELINCHVTLSRCLFLKKLTSCAEMVDFR